MYNTHGAHATMTAAIDTIQSTRAARSVLLGPSRSETRPAPKAATEEKMREMIMRLDICWSFIPKTTFAKRHTFGTATYDRILEPEPDAYPCEVVGETLDNVHQQTSLAAAQRL